MATILIIICCLVIISPLLLLTGWAVSNLWMYDHLQQNISKGQWVKYYVGEDRRLVSVYEILEDGMVIISDHTDTTNLIVHVSDLYPL